MKQFLQKDFMQCIFQILPFSIYKWTDKVICSYYSELFIFVRAAMWYSNIRGSENKLKLSDW